MMKRRQFLSHVGALAGTAALSQLGVFAARSARAATGATDYKALVCVFLYGGNDSNNMMVPVDAAGYAGYAKARANLALPQSTLLPLAEAGGQLRYGLHPALPGVHSLWNSGTLAVVANVGTLVQPLTLAQYMTPGTPVPAALFSHIDQQHQWQSSVAANSLSPTGWGGRLADQLAALNANATLPAMISTGGNNLFVTGAANTALGIPVSGSFGLSGYSNSAADAARRTALNQLLTLDNGTDLTHAAQNVMSSALACSASLNPILTATTGAAAARFAAFNTDFAQQLLAVAKVIEARAQFGAQRQVFLVTLGSFDTHTNQLFKQQSLLSELDAGLAAFHGAMADIGAANLVTSFTLSEFARTYAPNSSGGSDHAWGSHHLVAGGAVKGGKIYGAVPTLELGGPDDVDEEGRWIPTIAVDQYAATLATWFGVSANQLAAMLPNLGAFSKASIGFV